MAISKQNPTQTEDQTLSTQKEEHYRLECTSYLPYTHTVQPSFVLVFPRESMNKLNICASFSSSL